MRDSIVLIQQDGQYRADRVRTFLSHSPPGREGCPRDKLPNIAEVAWFAKAVQASGVTDGMADNLGCPVLMRAWEDDPTGDLCLVKSLMPCRLALLPHCSHPQNLLVVSRFASCLHAQQWQVPAYVMHLVFSVVLQPHFLQLQLQSLLVTICNFKVQSSNMCL